MKIAVGGSAGAGVDQVVEAFSVALPMAFANCAGGDCAIVERQSQQVPFRVKGVFQRHRPGFAAGQPAGPHIPARIHQ